MIEDIKIYLDHDFVTQEDQGTKRSRKLWFRVFTQGIRDALKGKKSAKKWLQDRTESSKKKIGSAMWIVNELDICYFEKILDVVQNGSEEKKKKLAKKLA